MYTIIKGDDEFGGGKTLSGTMGGGLLLQNDPSCSVFYDPREVLIDFTLKDNSPNVTTEKIDNSFKTKHQSYSRNEVQKVIRTKEPKFQFTSENPVMDLSEECYKTRIDSNYSQRGYEFDKDDSNNFIAVSRNTEKEDLRSDSLIQFSNYERGGIMFEDNQVKEIFNNLMTRRDMDTDRLLLKEFENNPIFGSEHGLILQGEKPVVNILPASYIERTPVNRDEHNSETSILMSSRQSMQAQAQKINSLSSLIIEHGQNLIKKSSAPLGKHEERINEKTTTTSTSVMHDLARSSNKPAHLFQDHAEPKMVSTLDLSSEDIRFKNVPHSSLYFHEGLDEMSTSQFSQGKQRPIENPSYSYLLNQKYAHSKNTVPFSLTNEEMRINEASLSMGTSQENVEIRETPSPYCNSFQDSQLNTLSGSTSCDQGQFRFRSEPLCNSSHPEQISLKNSSPYIISFGEDLTKNDSNEIDINRTLSHIGLSREQLKMMASSGFAQGLVQSKNIQSCDQELYQSKLSSTNFSSQQDQDRVRKKILSPYSTVQLELAVKNDSSILEKALSGFRDGSVNLTKAHTAGQSSRTIIQDPGSLKNMQASYSKNMIQENKTKNITSSPLVTHLKRGDNFSTRMEENKIKHFSFPIYDDNQKQSTSEQKQLRASSFQLEENEVMDFRLKDGTFQYNPSLSSQGLETLALNPALRFSRSGGTMLKETPASVVHSVPAQTKESFQNQPSVIAQIGMSCKVCHLCQSFYLENGFLDEEESCTLCLYHAKNGMKCVCDHSFIKEETCTCGVEKYGCSYCDKTFPTILLLQKHTFNHISEDSYLSSDKPDSISLHVCPICNSSFLSNTSLEHHLLTHKEHHCSVCNRTFKQFNAAKHSCDARYVCNLCGAGFASNYNLKMHLLKHSGSLPYKCRECSKSFAKPSELSKHSLVHSGERPFSCDECTMSFTNSTNLRSHKTTHSNRKAHSCQICNKSFTRPADVKRHMVIHTGVRPYACEVCGLAFADASNMRKHLSIHTKPPQGSDIRTYHCTICGKMFSRPSELKRHFITHTNARPYACHICGLAFTDASNLKKHVQMHERATEHVCLQCNANIKSFAELEMHMSLSHGTKRFDTNAGLICQTCGASFTQLADLQDHVLSHAPAPSFRCEICSKNFNEQVFLEKHLLTHTESRPFICNECSKSFKSLPHLRSHMLIHTGEKTHVCMKCNRSFLKKSSLLRHQAIHEREKVLAMYQFA